MSMKTFDVSVVADKDAPVDPATFQPVQATGAREAALVAAEKRWPRGAERVVVYVALGMDRHATGVPFAVRAFEMSLTE